MPVPMMYQKIQTATGPIEVPIYALTDITTNQFRIYTPEGVGCYELVEPTNETPFRIMTSSGIKGVNLVVGDPVNLIDYSNVVAYDATILENTADYIRVSTPWTGTGIKIGVTGMIPNKEYTFSASFEVEGTTTSQPRFNLRDVTASSYIFAGLDGTSSTGLQTVSLIFNSGAIATDAIIELEVLNQPDDIAVDDPMTYKIYKAQTQII